MTPARVARPELSYCSCCSVGKQQLRHRTQVLCSAFLAAPRIGKGCFSFLTQEIPSSCVLGMRGLQSYAVLRVWALRFVPLLQRSTRKESCSMLSSEAAQFSCHSTALKMPFLSVEYILSLTVNNHKNLSSSPQVALLLRP